VSNLFSLPFLLNIASDPERADAVAKRIGEHFFRMFDDGLSHSYLTWVRFFDRLAESAYDPVLSDLGQVAFVNRILEDTQRRGLYALQFTNAYARQRASGLPRLRRSLVQTLAGLYLGSAEGVDREAIEAECDRIGCPLWSCSHCDGVFLDDDLQTIHRGGLVCEGCRDDSFEWSSRYDAWVHGDSVRRALDEDGDRCVIDEDDDDFHFDEELDRYIHNDYEPPSRAVIRSYHSSKPHFSVRQDSWVANYRRALGVELEVEGHSIDPSVAAAAIHARVNGGEYGRHVFFERDGSLSNGFELISQPMSVPALRETFSFLRDPAMVRGLRSHRTSTCGLHVHVTRAGLSNLTIARAVTFVNDSGNDAFIQALARRYNTGFCNIRDKDLETAHLPGDRYEAINLTGLETIEFRIFRGSLKFEAVIAAVEFCHGLLEYCARPETGAGGLNAQSFLRWAANHLTDETAILRSYVSDRMAGLFQHSEAA